MPVPYREFSVPNADLIRGGRYDRHAASPGSCFRTRSGVLSAPAGPWHGVQLAADHRRGNRCFTGRECPGGDSKTESELPELSWGNQPQERVEAVSNGLSRWSGVWTDQYASDHTGLAGFQHPPLPILGSNNEVRHREHGWSDSDHHAAVTT